jgi:hypothetical protein
MVLDHLLLRDDAAIGAFTIGAGVMQRARRSKRE